MHLSLKTQYILWPIFMSKDDIVIFYSDFVAKEREIPLLVLVFHIFFKYYLCVL